jgi:hypothetical protein
VRKAVVSRSVADNVGAQASEVRGQPAHRPVHRSSQSEGGSPKGGGGRSEVRAQGAKRMAPSAERILLRPASRDFGGQVAQSRRRTTEGRGLKRKAQGAQRTAHPPPLRRAELRRTGSAKRMAMSWEAGGQSLELGTRNPQPGTWNSQRGTQNPEPKARSLLALCPSPTTLSLDTAEYMGMYGQPY